MYIYTYLTIYTCTKKKDHAKKRPTEVREYCCGPYIQKTRRSVTEEQKMMSADIYSK
jgi:hypothetical protein